MRFWCAAVFLAMVAAMHAEQPFDFASTPGKLPKTVRPSEYAVRIVPKIDNFTFTGSETVKIEIKEPTRELVLNVLELEIASAAIDDQPLAKSAIKIDKKEELLRLILPNELPARAHTLSLTFSGKINQQGQGL